MRVSRRCGCRRPIVERENQIQLPQSEVFIVRVGFVVVVVVSKSGPRLLGEAEDGVCLAGRACCSNTRLKNGDRIRMLAADFREFAWANASPSENATKRSRKPRHCVSETNSSSLDQVHFKVVPKLWSSLVRLFGFVCSEFGTRFYFVIVQTHFRTHFNERDA